MPDARVERAERLADLALRLAGPAAGRGASARPRGFTLLRRPVRRREGELARRELVEAAAYDRGALIRAADAVEHRTADGALAMVARTLLVDSAAQITSR